MKQVSNHSSGYQLPRKPENLYGYALVRNITMHDHKTVLWGIFIMLFLNVLVVMLKPTAQVVPQQAPTEAAFAAENYTEPAQPDLVYAPRYELVIQDEDRYVLMYKERVLHVFDRGFHPNCDVFKVIDRQNQ